MINIKSPEEIKAMQKGGMKLSEISAGLREKVKPEITTMDLEEAARKLFDKKKMKPAFLNYGSPPFPASICTSLNHEIVHGIPSEGKRLKEGDIISIDVGGIWEGLYVDMAFTVRVGKPEKKHKKLISVTEKALEAGIKMMIAGNQLYDISWAIQQEAENNGYNVVRELVGHGIGRRLHEHPNVPNYGKKGTGMKLKNGVVLALEPMLNMGTHRIKYRDDGWTVVTEDEKFSSHFEKTVAITKNGPKVLTEYLWKKTS